MSLIKKPVTGMKDIMPDEMAVRDYVISQITETYQSFGYTRMETPCVEHIENLCSKQGGDNEKLIFKILKRGEKLKIDEAKEENDLIDGGLRYDLTVPLARYYACHANELPSPFKALQMGNVWRADRPQRGRYRQFMQCDIDILGEPGIVAEIDLILATSTLLGKLGFRDFTIRINDRRMLKAMASYAGFAEESYDDVFIILDKMDKIGLSGVREELLEKEYAPEAVERFLSLFADPGKAEDGESVPVVSLSEMAEKLSGVLDSSCPDGMAQIMQCVEEGKSAEFSVVFDPTLVRGMSYYTGTIFEIDMDGFGASVGGGGRYDEMIGKFTGQAAPACGFSIGFERIILLLMEQGFKVPSGKERTAFLMDKRLSAEKMSAAMKEAMELRTAGGEVLVTTMKKNKKFQKEQLAENGYTDFREFYES